jgi:hypothetical protein
MGRMKHFLIDMNLSLYYWLRRKIGQKRAYSVARAIEKSIRTLRKRSQVGEKVWGEDR